MAQILAPIAPYRKENMADVEEQLLLWALLVIILRRRRRRTNLKRRRKRFWVRDIYQRRAAQGEYANLVRELRLGDREFYFR